MKRLRLVIPGRLKSFWREGVEEFAKRLRRYEPVEIVTAREIPVPGSPAQFLVWKRKQWHEIERRLRPGAKLLVFDVKGTLWTTEDVVSLLREIRMSGISVDMVIGGPLGLSKDAFARASYVVSVSGFTLTHQMTALLVMEQLYRASKIIAGEPYAY